MRRRTGWIVVTLLCLLITAGCQRDEGDTMLSEDDWTSARQQQIDLVTEVAHQTSTDAYVVIETVGACETGDDLDRSIASADYVVTARPLPDAQAQLDQVLRPRLEADGWDFRDRTAEPNQLDGTTLDYYWTRGDANLDVTISDGGDGRPVVQVSGLSECGKRGDVRSGRVGRDDPWYLAPRVDGPTIDDNHPIE